MDTLEAIQARHSVREFIDRPIASDLVAQLEEDIAIANAEGGLSLQLRLNEPGAFSNIFAEYGVFTNVNNYIAVVAKRHDEGRQKAGYHGQSIVLKAHQLGLNACWVGGTYSKKRTIAKVGLGEKLHAVIALGYGENQGKARKTKPIDVISMVKDDETPFWFEKAMEAVQLAPTAMNQQRFFFTFENGIVTPKVHTGFFTHISLGIAKFHFEVGAAAAGAIESDWMWSE